MGNQVTKYPVKNVKLKVAGKSTLGGKELWFDNVFGRLNTDEKGSYLGSFQPGDSVFTVYQDGTYQLTGTELTQRFDSESLLQIEKFDPLKIVTAIYLDKEKLQFNVKRFQIETTTMNTKFSFIKEGEGNYLEAVSTVVKPIAVITSGKGAQSRTSKVKIADFVEIMGWKAIGNKLTDYTKSTQIIWQDVEGNKKQAELF